MKKWILSGVIAVVVLGIAGTIGYALWFTPSAPATTNQPAPPATATVTKTDLSTSVSISGSLGYGNPVTFTGRKAGTVTWLPPVGKVVNRGQKLYAVDAKPVVLFFGDTPLYRKLDNTVSPGPDVKELNANLRALGFRSAPSGSEFTAGTADALKQWQHRNELDDTGTLDVGDVVMLPGAVRVESVKAQPGAAATADLLDLTGTTKVVTASVDPAEVDVAVLKPGRQVTLSLPDGKQTPGTIASVGTETEGAGHSGDSAGQQNSSNAAGRSATITIDDQATVSDMDSGSIGVTVTTETREGVLTVPVGALLALQEGGYAVQVVDAGRTTLIAVRTGMFADGKVEVSGQGLTEGLKVVTVS